MLPFYIQFFFSTSCIIISTFLQYSSYQNHIPCIWAYFHAMVVLCSWATRLPKMPLDHLKDMADIFPVKSVASNLDQWDIFEPSQWQQNRWDKTDILTRCPTISSVFVPTEPGYVNRVVFVPVPTRSISTLSSQHVTENWTQRKQCCNISKVCKNVATLNLPIKLRINTFVIITLILVQQIWLLIVKTFYWWTTVKYCV